MLIHPQQHHHVHTKYYADSMISSVSSNIFTAASSSLTRQRPPSAQVVFSQLKDNRFVVQNSSSSQTNSASTFKHPIMDRKIIINQIEFDYLNRVTRTINEQDIMKHDEKEKELQEKLNASANREADLKLASVSRSSQMGGRNSCSSRNFTLKTKQKLLGNNELLPGFKTNKSNNKPDEQEYNNKEKNSSFQNEKKNLIDLNLVNRKSLVHSAPAKILRRKSSIDSNYSTSSSSSTSDAGSDLSSDSGVQDDYRRGSSARPKSSLRFSVSKNQDNSKFRNSSVLNSKDYKSIMREQQQIFSKTMSVDKWVAIHKRPRTSVSLSSSHHFNSHMNPSVTFAPQIDQKTSIKDSKNGCSDSLKQPQTDNNNNKNGIDGVMQRQKQLQQLTRKVRSVKELSQLNLIDNIQMRIKREVQDNLKKISRNQNQAHFNLVVERVRSFLTQVDEFNDFKNSNASPVIKLYEYNVAEI